MRHAKYTCIRKVYPKTHFERRKTRLYAMLSGTNDALLMRFAESNDYYEINEFQEMVH